MTAPHDHQSTSARRVFEILADHPGPDTTAAPLASALGMPESAVTAALERLRADGQVPPSPEGSLALVEGERRYTTTLPIWYSRSPRLDPQRWPVVRAAVIEVGYRFRFAPGLTRSNVAGNYVLTLIDNAGASAEVGAAVNATLSLSTGCHLIRAARSRGMPAPESTSASWSARWR